MPSEDDKFLAEDDDEIEQIIETAKEIKLEKKKRPRAKAKTAAVSSQETAKPEHHESPKPQTLPLQTKAPAAPVSTTKPKKVRIKQPQEDAKAASSPEQVIEVTPIPREAKLKGLPAVKAVSPQETAESKPKTKFETLELPKSQDFSPETKKSEIPEAPKITAHDILTKSEDELKSQVHDKRESFNLLQDLKIITAILLGKDKNKELSQVLQTDKSFTSKQINDLEEQGLVKKEGEGKDTRYTIDQFNVMKFLQTRVVIRWKAKKEHKEGGNGT